MAAQCVAFLKHPPCIMIYLGCSGTWTDKSRPIIFLLLSPCPPLLDLHAFLVRHLGRPVGIIDIFAHHLAALQPLIRPGTNRRDGLATAENARTPPPPSPLLSTQDLQPTATRAHLR